MVDPAERNAVTEQSSDGPPLLFAQGYGCDQNAWALVAPRFADTHRVVTYDLMGFGRSDRQAYHDPRYATLDGHARDMIEVCEAAGLERPVVVAHSVSAMSATLAAIEAPDLFSRIVMVAPSPCYLNDGDYHGGFEQSEIDGLIAFMDENYLGWSGQMASTLLSVTGDQAAEDELRAGFCANDPTIARHFARVTFASDHREAVRRCPVPTTILQCTDDVIAPVEVGDWMAAHMPNAEVVRLEATGHCPHITAAEETVAALRSALV